MQPSAEELVLHRVSLRGTGPAIDAARAPLKTALEQASWPTTAPGELLFLRKIITSGNPRELAAHAAEQARRLADNAVDGKSPAAANAMAVRFRNHADLLTCLIRDLLHGSAAQRWYWRRWQHVLLRPMDEAIVALLEETPLYLPAVLAQLRATSAWQPFWKTLGVSGGERLLAIAAHAGGWTATVNTARVLIAKAVNVDGKTEVREQENIRLPDLTFLAARADDSRYLLAALVTLWQQAPTLLLEPAAAAHLQQLVNTIVGDTSRGDAVSRSNIAHDMTGKHTPPSLTPDSDSVAVAITSPGDPENEQSKASPLNIGTHMEIVEGDVVAASNPEQLTPAETGSPPKSFVHDFITHQGGLFYLLNFLNLPTVRAQLPADQPGAGWRWLHNLATALGCPPEGELLEFLATECGLENGAELARQPPLAEMDQLLRLGAARYGGEVWQPGTWRIPARLTADASHVDLHFRLDDAHLAMRRVGLDVNPGWLPWLGRVVTFHYGSGLEPLR